MKPQHLSDEAVAAFADGVLRGHARERAQRHTAECAECACAVTVQREAVWALRSAPAPPLPSGLMQRLCDVPATTPISVTPAALGKDGSTLMATFGALTPSGVAAVVDDPPAAGGQQSEWMGRLRPVVGTAVAVAAAGMFAVASAAHAGGSTASPPADRTRNPRAGTGPAGRLRRACADSSLMPLGRRPLRAADSKG